MPTEKDNLIFSDYCYKWLSQQEATVRTSSYAKYSSLVEKHIMLVLGKCRLSELSSERVAQFAQEKTEQDELSAKTVHMILGILHSILDYVQKETHYDFSGVVMPYPKLVRKKKQALTSEEQERLLRFLLEEMDTCKFGIFLSIMAGLQIGEICALQWGDISISERTVTAANTLQRVKNFNPDITTKTVLQIGPSKRKSDEQKIHLTEMTVAYCKKFRQEDGKSFVLTGTRACMEPRALQYRLKRYMTACDLPQVHFETLRYGFSTRCIEVDFEMEEISNIVRGNI
ncbi:MAG: site-specific integrase [Clostridiales bacterium]|nr:site-specific integrase [Clostridiales bacterium]